MMYQTKAATQSLSVVAQVVAIITMSLKLAGVDISAEVADVPANVAAGIDAALILAAQATALYGRLRANKQIRGIFKVG